VKTLLILAAPVILSASCASDSGNTNSAATAPRKSFTERMTEDNGYKQDSEGNWKPRSDKRSSFESQSESNFAGKDYKKQEYKAGDYAKKSWWGGKEYERQAYAGNTDGSRFQKNSDLQGKGARETATTLDTPDAYATNSYTTGAAREANAAAIKKTSNDEIENRRKVFDQPEIIGWREQRAMSMEQSKGLLGR
jgi:hypothetical protein